MGWRIKAHLSVDADAGMAEEDYCCLLLVPEMTYFFFPPARETQTIWYFDKQEFINTRENLDLWQRRDYERGWGQRV